MSKFKIKHGIFGKIVFIFPAIGAIALFLIDLVKDFIPDDQWEIKLAIALVGILSSFFSIISFYWDKKFSEMTKQLSTAYDSNFDELTSSIHTFLEEDLHAYDAFNDAIAPIFSATSEFVEVCIFAYSAKNYIEWIKRSNIKIRKLRLCLKRADDYSAWCVRSNELVEKYKKELWTVLDNLEALKEQKIVEDYEVRFYDFESHSHFGIFNDSLIFGDLLPLFARKKTVKICKVYVLSNIGRNKNLYESKRDFFNNLYHCCGSDSGLKRTVDKCHYCDTSELIQNPHHVNGSLVDFGKCDISLINDVDAIDDFILEPDFHPISELHMLLVSKFHILNLFDYLYHKNAVAKLQEVVYKIRNTIYNITGREILIFEHGTSVANSDFSSGSIEHLHLHVIYEPQSYNYFKAIIQDNKKNQIFDASRGVFKFQTIEEFSQEPLIKNKDYFMIWKPGESINKSKVFVWLPTKKASQYLRKIFFQGLTCKEKHALYGDITDDIYDDEYDWKKYVFNYSDSRLEFHKSMGKAIEDEIRNTDSIS